MSYTMDKAIETLEKSGEFLGDETVEEAGVWALIAIAGELVRVRKAIENLDHDSSRKEGEL